MTYVRPKGGFAAALTRIKTLLGEDALAVELGLSPSRLRQCANPARRDTLPLDLAAEADISCARAGGGVPLWEAYTKRLAEAGALPEYAGGAKLARMTGAVEAAGLMLRRCSDMLAEVLTAPMGAAPALAVAR